MKNMKNIKRISLVVLSIVAIYGALSMATSAYFNDVEKIKDNSIAAGTWMGVDPSSAILTGNGYTLLHNIFLIPDRDSDTIDKIVVSWTDNKGESIDEIRINGKLLWSGNAKSGDVLDLEGYVLDKKEDSLYRFNSDMHGKTFTIGFIMDDGQVIENTFEPKWKDEKPEIPLP